MTFSTRLGPLPLGAVLAACQAAGLPPGAADSYHGVDGAGPVRLRADVPNGVSPQGVHQGGHPAARVQALAAPGAFWPRVFDSRKASSP